MPFAAASEVHCLSLYLVFLYFFGCCKRILSSVISRQEPFTPDTAHSPGHKITRSKHSTR